MAAYGIAAGGRQYCIIGAGDFRCAGGCQILAIDALEQRSPSRWRNCETDGIFREPIDRHHGGAGKSKSGKSLQEIFEGRHVDRLGAAKRHPPGRQIAAVQLGFMDARLASFIGEVGAARYGVFIVGYRPEPALRAGEERQRRHQHQRYGVCQAAELGADQPHIMIERQSAYEDVVGRDLHPLAHGPNIGEQVGMGEHHALGIAGVPRCISNERGIAGGRAGEVGWNHRAF